MSDERTDIYDGLLTTNGNAFTEDATFPIDTSLAQSTPPARDDGITITFKKTQHAIEIDMDQLTWEDALHMRQYREKAQSGEITDDEAEQLLNTIVQKVTGKDPLKLPVAVVNRVVAAIFSNSNEAGNQGN